VLITQKGTAPVSGWWKRDDSIEKVTLPGMLQKSIYAGTSASLGCVTLWGYNSCVGMQVLTYAYMHLLSIGQVGADNVLLFFH
jgi:hypothetical protein